MKKSVITKTLFAILSLVFFSSVAMAIDNDWQCKSGVEVYSFDAGNTFCRVSKLEDGTLEVLGFKYDEDKTFSSRFSIYPSKETSGHMIEAPTYKGVGATPEVSEYNVFKSECLTYIKKNGLPPEIRETLERATWKK